MNYSKIARRLFPQITCFVICLIPLFVVLDLYQITVHDAESYYETECTVISHQIVEVECTEESSSEDTGPCYEVIWQVKYETYYDLELKSEIESLFSFDNKTTATEEADKRKDGSVQVCYYDTDPGDELDVEFEIYFGLLTTVWQVIMIIIGIVCGILLLCIVLKGHRVYKEEKLDHRYPNIDESNELSDFPQNNSPIALVPGRDSRADSSDLPTPITATDPPLTDMPYGEAANIPPPEYRSAGSDGYESSSSYSSKTGEVAANSGGQIQDVGVGVKEDSKNDAERILILMKTEKPQMKLGAHVSIFDFLLDSSSTIGNVKERLSRKEDIPTKLQKLMFNAQIQDDDSKTLDTLGINSGRIHFVVIKNRS